MHGTKPKPCTYLRWPKVELRHIATQAKAAKVVTQRFRALNKCLIQCLFQRQQSGTDARSMSTTRTMSVVPEIFAKSVRLPTLSFPYCLIITNLSMDQIDAGEAARQLLSRSSSRGPTSMPLAPPPSLDKSEQQLALLMNQRTHTTSTTESCLTSRADPRLSTTSCA